jgi:hypothetical protein
VTVSAIQPLIIGRGTAKINEEPAEHAQWLPGVIRSMALVLKLVQPKRTGGRGHSKGLPNKLMGYVIECLVEAYILLGAGGRLTTARPDSDVDHKDFIVDLLGGFQSIYLQVKGSANLRKHGMVEVCVTYASDKVMTDPRLVYIFCFLDIKSMSLTRIWLIPATDFRRLAPKTALRNGHTQYTFMAGNTGKWARFEIDPLSIGERLVKYVYRLNRRAAA